MKRWIVGTGKDAKTFEDVLEAYEYRGRLSRLNGHHKHIPVREEQGPDYHAIADLMEKMDDQNPK